MQVSIDVGHADLPVISLTNMDRYYVVASFGFDWRHTPF
jgi:hypothetical protein